MSTDFTFPLALYKAQCSICLHTLEMFETIGSRILRDGIALTRTAADTVMRAEDWQALAMTPMLALRYPSTDDMSHAPPAFAAAQAGPIEAAPSRRAVVDDALDTLHGALAAASAVRRPHAGRKAIGKRGKA